MDAGRLRHRVTFQYQVETQNPQTGAIQVAWEDLATVWAAIEPVSTRDFIAAQAEQSKIMARIIIRYRDDISSKMRLYHEAKDHYYQIEGEPLPDKDSGMEYLTLPVSHGVKE